MKTNAAHGRSSSKGLLEEEIREFEERLREATRDPVSEETMCLTDREVAYVLAVSPRTVGRFAKDGRFKAVYLTSPNRTRRILLTDLRTFIRQATEA